MPAIAVWTIALLVVAGVIALMALMAFGLGRASSRADEESERQVAEHLHVQRENVLAQAQADAEAEVQAEAEAELQAELAAKRGAQAESPQDAAPQKQDAEDGGVEIARRG
ncbi:MAG: hypothetical protein ACTHM1_08075 [Solirubrobacteraceae bacterium]